jgi:hypothetical protein
VRGRVVRASGGFNRKTKFVDDWTISRGDSLPRNFIALSYAKVAYRSSNEAKRWDTLGWLGHSIGYTAILNSTGILLYGRGFVQVAWMFLGVVVSLFLIYSIVDVHAKRKRWKEKLLKLLFYFALLFIGLVLPIVAGWA